MIRTARRVPSRMRRELSIERMSQLGEGVALWEGRTVFVRGAVAGERVLAEVREEGRVLRGELVDVLAPSPFRRAPACPLAERCGGCDWLHLEEGEQRRAKLELTLSALEHQGGILRDALEVRPLLAPSSPLGYRRRAVLHAQGDALGFFGHRSHDHVGVDRCPALVAPLAELPGRLAAELRPLLKELSEVTLVAEGDQVAIALRLRGPVKPRHLTRAEAAIRALKLQGAVIVPKEGKPQLVGKPVLRALSPLHPEVPHYLRPDAFAQANAAASTGLVSAAVYQLAPAASDRALELYCGNGNFTFALAALCAHVTGVESSAEAVELAQKSARAGAVGNVRWIQGQVEKVCEGLRKEGAAFDLLLLDPPRTGAPEVAAWATHFGVKRLVYVACDVGSLARDARSLTQAGFRPKALQLVDMFPQTRHSEALLSFERA